MKQNEGLVGAVRFFACPLSPHVFAKNIVVRSGPIMFENPRYVSRAIADAVAVDIQQLVWALLDERVKSKEELDYLQVFDLAMESMMGECIQKVLHQQEQPFYENLTFHRTFSMPLTMTIWVIDDGDHTTMLLPSEY